jgi:VWFA-related protein
MRHPQRILILTTALLTLVPTLQFSAQQPPQGPPQTVIRINVNLVQVDAVVTDSKGKAVTDLKLEDFELLQDGKPQKITAVDFINVKDAPLRGAPPTRGTPARGTPRGGPPPPLLSTTPLRPNQIRRTVALVVDDLGLSFDSSVRVRQSLKKWIESQMQPGDLVAVLRTSAGMGALQQFTRDKRLLYSAVDLVRYQVGRVGTSSFAPLRGIDPDAPDTTLFDREVNRAYSIGSMGAIQYIVQGLRDMPGRKSVVLFSESMQLRYPDGRDQQVEEALRQLTDAANRAAVVIYAIDPRGVAYTGLTAEDSTRGMTAQQVSQVATNRTNSLMDSQEGMLELSEKTGGMFLANNDVEGSLRQVIDDGDGYYLLGYQPAIETFDVRPGMAKFHKLEVRVKRPGLKVRSRTGFFGTPDRRAAPPTEPIQQITRALSSPFSTSDVRVRLTTLFSYNDKQGSYINALLFIDPHDITFSQVEEGFRTSLVDIAAVTFDVNGRQIDGASRSWKFRVPEKSYEEVLRSGIVYSMHIPIKKAGPYQTRVVLRDSSSKLGSATQFIEIPDVKSGKLALSGIVLTAQQRAAESSTDSAEGVLSASDPNSAPAVRIFKPGTSIVYAYEILNAKMDKQKNHQVEIQTRLFRDGEQVFASPTSSVNSAGQKESNRLFGVGQMQLTTIPPGDYALQVIVTDKLARDKNKLAAQAMNFEIQQ